MVKEIASCANEIAFPGVIGAMKPLRKMPGMYRSRVSPSSLVASTALVCVVSLAPSLAPSLAAAHGGISHLSPARGAVVIEVASRGEGLAPADALARRPGDAASSGDRRLAQSTKTGSPAAQADDQPAEIAPDGAAPAGDGTATPPEATPDATGSGDQGDFSGSASPAGPDLTANQEQALIANGWQ